MSKGVSLEFKGRGTERVKSDNLIAFILFDSNGKMVNQGMAKAMDISRTGVALEFHDSLEQGLKIEMTMGMGDEVVKTKGVIKNVAVIDEHSYHIGVEFDFLTEEDLNRIGMIYPSVIK